MAEKIKIDFKNKNGIIICSPNILKLVREKFSIKNPSYQMARFVPRLYSITPLGVFQVGLWNEIEHYLRSLSLKLDITLTQEFKDQYTPNTGITEISTIQGFDYYDYQIDTLKEFFSNGRGISMIATGGGKALICGGICKTFLDHYPNYKILICVPNVSLLHQLHRSFLEEFGIDNVTVWGDGNLPDKTKNILIANNQILISDVKATVAMVKDYDVVIIDEVHTINEKKNKISKVIHNIITPKKFGLTATLPDSISGAWNVVGKVGPILYEKSSHELRKQGTITEVEINIIVLKHKKKPKFPRGSTPTEAYDNEIDYVVNMPERNEVIKKIAKRLEGNVLVIMDRRAHIDILADALKDIGKKIVIITGDTPAEERIAIQDKMNNETGIVCLAMSKCFSTGVSVNNLHYAVFVYMGKGGVKTVQTIGRTVRKHSSKDKAVIFDIADSLEYSWKHLKKRIKIYEEQKVKYKISKITI